MRSSLAIAQTLRVILFVIGTAGAAVGQQSFPAPIAAPDAANSSGVNGYADYFAGGDDLQFVLFQPPPELSTPPQPAPRRYATGGRQAGNRLASVPNMFGDAPTAPVTSQFGISVNTTFVTGTIPTPGFGGAGAKLAENDRPIPTDRVFFSYNHFNNVFEVVTFTPSTGTRRQTQSIDRYTFGFEKTFDDGWSSVALRVPMYGDFGYQLNNSGLDGGQFGNLAVVLKHLLYYDDAVAIGAGMAISTPTGNDVVVQLDADRMRIRNEAVYLLPYIGFNYSPGDPQWGWGDGLFLTGVLQLSVAANGNTIVAELGPTAEELGKYNDQTLMLLDIGAGYWLYRDPYAPRCTGLAVVGEIHYTTALQDSDFAGGEFPLVSFALGSEEANRFDIVNFTIGIEAILFDASSFRVAGAFPLGSDPDERVFDSEVQFQFNRRF